MSAGPADSSAGVIAHTAICSGNASTEILPRSGDFAGLESLVTVVAV